MPTPDKKIDERKLKLIGLSILVYIATSIAVAVIGLLTEFKIPSPYSGLISLIPAIYFYKTHKEGQLEMKDSEQKRKMNWKVFGLGVLVYYIVVILLARFLLHGFYGAKFYRLIISILIANYYYQIQKNKTNLKTDMILIGVTGVAVIIIIVLDLVK